MGKRKSSSEYSQAETRLNSQRSYNKYIKDAKTHNSSEQRIVSSPQLNGLPDGVLQDVSNGEARKCYECDCTNDQGFCDNYHLYAVIRNMCMVPVKGGGQDE